MDFDDIMLEVTSGLTGSADKDVAYLLRQAEKYKTHPLAREIARACFRLMYDLLPDDKKAEFGQASGNDTAAIHSTLEEAHFLAYKQDFPRALALVETLINKLEAMDAFNDDTVSEYHTFNELFEAVLYHHLRKSEKDLRQAPLPYAAAYTLYGSIRFELKRFEDAKTALEKAMRWNPISSDAVYEHAEACKKMGDLDAFYRLTKEVMRVAFRPRALARGLRNLAYYFVEKQEYAVANACLHRSLLYEKEAPAAQSELYYIQSKTGGRSVLPTEEELRQYSVRYDFPIEASDDVLSLAYAYGKHHLLEKEFDKARYFLEIVYGLTDDERIGAMLDELPEQKQQ